MKELISSDMQATPDWSRYYMDYGWDGEFVTIIAGSQRRLVELINASELLWGVDMNLASRQVEVVRPWRTLHWKTLPERFRAVVPYEKIRVPFFPRNMSREEAEAENRKSSGRGKRAARDLRVNFPRMPRDSTQSILPLWKGKSRGQCGRWVSEKQAVGPLQARNGLHVPIALTDNVGRRFKIAE
ncbi:MAG: hypothetical protein R6U98_11695 [Pirellulaceae bacterium]